ncbi:gliding motility-associated C-terminal domain-containing protein [Ferruginibacter sp.]|uniref:gliding motility-associated C-terminal domain-containing protein n=1 Tax=Ferruginibacter sp. TaxID=1940288 RepID=UPI0026596C79|nr:gliding motility-associated C-terminal domain-containing protein [Ferruginibacter sp.]
MNNRFTCYSILLGILLTMLIMYPAAALPKNPDNKSVEEIKYPEFPPTSTTNITICKNQLPYTWNNITCLKAGTYSAALVSSSGDDSTAILNLSVINVGVSVSNVIICDNQVPYTWNGHTYSQSGTYSVTLTSAAGCDSVPILSLTVNNFVTSTTTKTICSNLLPYTWNGNSYATAGTYKATLKSAAGCDSIATLVLAVKTAASSTTPVTICSSQAPYSWNGHSYSVTGIYPVSIATSAGCDSVAKLDLKVIPPATSSTKAAVCAAQLPYNWNGNSYIAAGTYSVKLKSYLNCDSVASLVLAVTPVKTTTTYKTICTSQLPYVWNGNSYTSAGNYSVTLNGSNGCDSIARLQLVTATVLTSATSRTICNSQLPYTWNGNSYAAAGTYTASFVTAAGCDSVATLKLAVETPSTKTDSLLLCNSRFPYNYHGHIFTEPGTYPIDPPFVVDACHSIVAVNIVSQLIPPGTTVKKLCINQLPFVWNGKPYTLPGHYSVTLLSATGCDSVANLDLYVNPVIKKDTNISICVNQTPYNWNGHLYNTSGTYVATLISSGGCDSVVTLHLSVSDTKTSDTTLTICNAQLPFKWNGKVFNSAGNYAVTVQSSGGCDSVISLHLAVQPFLTSTINKTVCNNQLPYQWNGNSYSSGGTYVANLKNVAGCDSIATLNLTVNNLLTSVTNVSTCISQLPYLWNGNSYTSSGTYTAMLITSGGCDSVATLNLQVGDAAASITELTICSNQLPYTWNGNVFPIAGTYPVTLASSSGCDSVATLKLMVKDILTSTTNVNVCDKELPYLWNGKSYNTGGTYSVTIKTLAGCDSVPVLGLTVLPYTTSTTNTTICSNQLPYHWNGKTYTAAGTYSILLTGLSVCDSLATLNLAVTAPDKRNIDIGVCPSQLPYSWNGHVFTSAGIFTTTLTNSTGCDSIVTANLSVRTVATSTSTISICTGQLPFSWNGHSYPQAGTYAVTLADRHGCDSIATLHLFVKANTNSITKASVCSAQLPYQWNGQSFTSSGLHVVTLRNAGGCDSVATLDLSVNATPPPPTVSPLSYCQYDIAETLHAAGITEGGRLLWYRTDTGGTASSIPSIPSTLAAGVNHYFVSQVSGACEGPRAMLAVTVHTKPTLGPDKNLKICFGDTLNLAGQYNTAGFTGTWTINQQPLTLPGSVTGAGSYQLIVKTNQGCLDTATVNLDVLPKVIAGAGKDDNAEYNAPYQLNGTGNGQFEWSPPEQLSNPFIANPTVKLTADETFTLTVKNELGCTAHDTVKLRVLKGPGFYVPNAFSPNGDGLNDRFRPTAVGISNLEYFRIFNRYGDIVFETSNVGEGWDGTYKGIKQNIGNYVWMIKGTDRLGRVKMLKGNVVLVR